MKGAGAEAGKRRVTGAKGRATAQQLANLAKGRATQRERRGDGEAGELPSREVVKRAHFELGGEAIRLARRKLRQVSAGKAASGAEVAALERLLRLGVDLQREAVAPDGGEGPSLTRTNLRFSMGDGG